MDRRHFLAVSLIVASGAAGGQPKPRRIGFLGVRSRSTPQKPDPYYDAFNAKLRELGYIEGKNIIVEWRFADGKYERLPGLADELVKSNVEVLVTHSTPGAQTLQRATSTVPIVFMAVGNPLELGLVRSLSRPGGNITGVANMTNEVGPKQVQLLKAVLPKLSRIGVLFNPQNTTAIVILESVQNAGHQIGVQSLPLSVRRAEEIEAAFGDAQNARIEALIVAADALFIGDRRQIIDRAAKMRLPAMFAFPEDAEAGGLMSYGPSLTDVYARAAVYVDKILKGAKAGEIPVEQPTQFSLVINAKTAGAIGLKLSDSLLSRADRVIR